MGYSLTFILVVEDDLPSQKDIVGLLHANGINWQNIKTATNLQKAKAAINLFPHHLLICDTELEGGPSGNRYGIEVAQFYRKKCKEGGLKGSVIGISSDPHNKEYWNGECNQFYQKPLSKSDIEQIIEQYLAN